MIPWTETARQTFDRYCLRARQSIAGTGADADEVIDDLRRHIEEDARSAKLPIVTEGDMQRILKRVGEPAGTETAQPQARPVTPPDDKRRPGFLLLIVGVILPGITIGFELLTGMSAGVLFDPFPTWFHLLLVSSVPALNLWMWRAGRARQPRHAKLFGWLNGVALAVCVWYAVLYIPFSPFAAFAVIYFGIGLIPLGPYFALIATPLIRVGYRASIGSDSLPGLKRGFAAGFALLVMLQLPAFLTYRGLIQAGSEDPATSRAGVRLLRMFGDRELMLRACYGMQRREWNMDFVHQIATGRQHVSEEYARTTYYRVTGQPFNAVAPPALYTRAGRWSMAEEEFTWDSALGGETVAGRVKGLSLKSSRLDALVEPDAGVAYCEWTLEFRNVSTQQREARAQIALPPGGVVSRLTLWVNGEEREAAFAGRGEVRAAYQKVAIVRRRDPVLVTTCGPDRVLMQCFPVPPDGGTMKVRVGITVPLALDSLDKGRFAWPKFLERNFALSDELKHAAWIDSPQTLTGDNAAFKEEHPKEKIFTLHGSLSEKEFAGNGNAIVVHRQPEVLSAWTPASEPNFIIRQTITESKPAPPKRVVLVIDGSEGMSDYAASVADAVAKLPENVEVSVLVAGDETVVLSGKPQKVTAEFRKALQKKLRSVKFAGGCDNLPALEKAWDVAAESNDGLVLWVHASQPFLVSSADALQQRLERSSQTVRLVGLQVNPGPNRIAETFDGNPRITFVPRFESVEKDLARQFSLLDGEAARFDLIRERVAQPSGVDAGKPASRHLERLWARDEALRLTAGRQREAATEIAAKNQLVTPVTGAVVLETKQQFDENNLKPADAQTVPSIPEPQAVTLLLLGGAMLLARKYFASKRARPAR